jgi:hypothetical protein
MIFLALAQAATFDRPLSLTELYQSSSTAVHGQVRATYTEEKAGLIWTVVSLEVFEGSNQEEIRFRVPGGCLDGLCLTVSGAPLVEEGQELVVFLRGDQLNNLALGLFHVEGNRLIQDSGEINFLQGYLSRDEFTLAEFRRLAGIAY